MSWRERCDRSQAKRPSPSLGKLYIQSGRWEDAIKAFRRAHELDPRNPSSLLLLATANGRLRHYDQGVKALNVLLDMSPDEQEAKLIKGQMYLRWKGSADTLLALLDRLPRGWDGRGMATFARYTALRAQRRYVDALKELDKTKATVSRDGVVYYPVSLMRAELHHALGDERVALTEYEDARRLLADSASAHPTDPAIHSSLALALAGLRRNQEAVKEAQRAMDLAPIGRSAGAATAVMGPAVEVFARVGNFNRAFEIAELLLTLPAGREMSVAFLQAWPGYAPLKSDPRFDVLIRRFTPR
jgi:Cytochrome c biogenesis factor